MATCKDKTQTSGEPERSVPGQDKAGNQNVIRAQITIGLHPHPKILSPLLQTAPLFFLPRKSFCTFASCLTKA
jgi:hypothetical protein